MNGFYHDAPTLPSDPQAEADLIGSLLLDPGRLADCRQVVAPRDFFDDLNRAIFGAICELADAGRAVDSHLVEQRLKANGETENVIVRLVQAADAVPTAANALDYTRTVALKAQQRRLFLAARDAGRVALDDRLAVRDPEAWRDAYRTALAAAEVAPQTGDEESKLVLRCMADVEPRAVPWLWPGRLPLGRISLLVGRPGEGKSFATIDMASRVSTGTPWPDGRNCPQGSVLLLTAEDDPADTIRPRLDAHKADVRRVHLLSAVRQSGRQGDGERLITLADVAAIEEALVRLTDCKLLIVDPIGSFLSSGIDSHRDNEVRSVLAPIAKLAEKHGPAVLVVAHRRKSLGSGETFADDLALGSRAFTGMARTCWHLGRDPNSKSRRLLLPGKNNLARDGDGLAFAIVGEPPRVAWETAPVTMSADEALEAEGCARDRKRGPDADAQAEAATWLRSALADGPRLTRDLVDEWQNGRGGSKRTLDRAKQAIGVEAYREDVPGPWWWRLPCKVAHAPDTEQPGNLGNVADCSGVSIGQDASNRKVARLLEPGNLDADRVRVVL